MLCGKTSKINDKTLTQKIYMLKDDLNGEKIYIKRDKMLSYEDVQ